MLKPASAPTISGRFKNAVVFCDLHDVNQHRPTVEALYDLIDRTKPVYRINLGDTFDWPGLRKGASKQEEYKGWKEGIESGIEFLHKIKPTHDVEGNHDKRIREELQSMSGAARYGAEKAIAEIDSTYKKIGTKRTLWGIGREESGLLRIGQQGFTHGYSVGSDCLKEMGGAYCMHIMFGHVHSFGKYIMPNIHRHISRSVASLCDNRKLEYQWGQRNALKHESGFANGVYDTQHGIFHLFDCYWNMGKFIIPEPKIK